MELFRNPEWGRVWSVKAHTEKVKSVSWSPDGRFLASGSVDGTVKILSAGTGATLRTLRGHFDSLFSVLFSEDGTRVFSCSWDTSLRVWRIFSPAEGRVRGLMGGLEVSRGDWEMREVCREIVGRMKRLWEVER